MVETYRALKQLSALFTSWHLVIRGFLLLTKTLFECRYNWLVNEWDWGSSIKYCQHAQAVVSFHQFYKHYRESSMCNHCCYCCRSTCSCHSFSFIGLIFSQLQIACCPSLNGHSEFFGLVESSAFDSKTLVFGFPRLWNLELVFANNSSGMKAADSNQSLKTIKFAASSGWSFRCCRHCSLSWTESFLVAELRTPSESSSSWNPSRVKTLTVFVTTFENGTMLLESSCLTGGCVYNFLSWNSKFDSRSQLLAENVPCLLICLWAETSPEIAAFAWPVRIIFRYCIFSVSLSRFWYTIAMKSSAHWGHSKGSPENSVSLSFGNALVSPPGW